MKVTSRQNPLIVRLSKLSDRKYRRAEGLFLAEGIKLAEEALAAGAVEYLIAEEGIIPASFEEKCTACGGSVITVSREVMEKVSTESAPQGVIAVCRTMDSLHKKSESATVPTGPLLILDRLRDPGNMGTVLRTAEAFGGVTLLTSGCADVYNPKTVRGSMGAVFRTPTTDFASTKDGVEFALSQGYTVLAAALDSDAKRLGSFTLPEKCAVVIGTEGEGLPDEIISLCSGSLYIPMSGGESLNASIAASVIMWEMYRGK